MPDQTSAGRDDTHSRTQDNPRAAGAASARGAQPPGPRCGYCHRPIFQTRNGAWYHKRTASVSCGFPDNTRTGRRAFPGWWPDA